MLSWAKNGDAEEIPSVFLLTAFPKEALPCKILSGSIHVLVGTGDGKDGHGTFQVWWELRMERMDVECSRSGGNSGWKRWTWNTPGLVPGIWSCWEEFSQFSGSTAAASIRDHCSLLFLGIGLCQQRVPRGEAEGTGKIPDPAPSLESNFVPLSCPKMLFLRDLLDVGQLRGAGHGSSGGRHMDIPQSIGYPQFHQISPIPSDIPHSMGYLSFHEISPIPSHSHPLAWALQGTQQPGGAAANFLGYFCLIP